MFRKLKEFFSDKQGKVVLYQRPNTTFVLAASAFLIGLLVPVGIHRLAYIVAFGFGFIWAYDEMIRGDTGFRRLIGFLSLVTIVYIMYTSVK